MKNIRILKKKIYRKTINIKKLTSVDIQRYVDALFPIFSEGIIGWSKERFAEDLFFKNSLTHNAITLFIDENHRYIGFNAHQIMKKKINAKTCYISKFYAVVKPEFKKNNLTMVQGFSQLFKFKLFHPFTQFYFIDFIMSPVAYYQLARACAHIHPKPGTEVPKWVKDIIWAMAEEYHVDLINPHHLVGRSEEVVNLSKAEKESLRTIKNQYMEYFIERAGLDGNGVFVLIHVTHYKLVFSLLRLCVHLFHRYRRRI
ncbi:hypothetical protein [Fluoribacter gormanii]|uniref:Uncharacterized protein n=1 Tax=Fluoribacter gormanii TaxID=464 RepID=A0A377GGK3_9GAMM|nr:hypothetical protein [Fluoribacter gormanii]KTD02433.1 hypothetical protein Lgor_1725 [Fluoribacter gormanii]SIR68608.1 hypothetical protein SAMN05421777_11932 [Fluoribacter gormanii]STO23665.1 Uncharacterised protein [Fluoribacter gormanii]